MPTDLELIASFTSLCADAKEVLQKLRDFARENKEVTWNLSGGISISTDSMLKMAADFGTEIDALAVDFYKDFGDAVTASLTYNSDGTIATETVTFSSGWQLIKALTYSGGVVASIGLTLKNGAGATIWTASRTISYNAGGQITGIA
jgi:hypothetical protein